MQEETGNTWLTKTEQKLHTIFNSLSEMMTCSYQAKILGVELEVTHSSLCSDTNSENFLIAATSLLIITNSM